MVGTSRPSGTSAQSFRPTSNAVLSHIRGLQPSLSFKRSTANPYVTSNMQPKPTSSDSKSSLRRKRHGTKFDQPSPTHETTSLKKATFQWVKGDLLGKGSYGQVYLALNATTGEVMAVKQVERPQTVSDRSNSRLLDIMQALKFESNTLKDLDHENIVQYLGYEESSKYLSIFLEYVPGGTISSCLKKYGRFNQEVTKSFTSQILAGLEYLHSKGILHRDLKADNILVEPTGICKISDFGISKKADIKRGRAFTGMKGTVFWMAPEILSSDGKGYDVKVDIWSVGCIVLEMWTGDRPWSGEELLPVMMKLVEHKLPPPVPRDIMLSECALDFRSQCFKIDPQDRPSAAELQKHPYLKLPNGWRFELHDMERPGRFPSIVSNKLRKSIWSTRHPRFSLFDSSQNTPPVPQLPAAFPSGDTTTPASDILRHPVAGGKHPQHRQDLDPDHGPQLVFITPPSSPVRDISRISHPSDTLGTPGFQRLKGFHVVNADPEPDPDKMTFIYSPPPLPGVDNKSPYSARLAPSSLHHPPYPPPMIRRNTQAPSTHSTMMHPASYYFTARSVDKPEAESRKEFEGDDNDESDDSDFGSSLWKRPPVDLTAGGLNDGQSRPASSISSQIRKAIFRMHHHEDDAEWAPRPVPEEVYDHLQEFFPHHDLDKAIIEVGLAGSTPEPGASDDSRRQAKKSIRMVAVEQNNQIGMRRKTKLWDSNVEELRM